MDGYSVQEAASVLGVAEGRVWELLARGVLLGTPEGDSMRVFLKAEPGPITTAGTRDQPPRTNGNGGSHGDGEASAFRELLTEFRNLTERYGQALLALGEARGEVAGLRSRVDQLEARFDLRLPPPIDAAPGAWESATIPASAPAPAPPRRAPVRRPPRSRKAPSARETVAGFADALARAQDPNAADLGESEEPEASFEASAEPAAMETPTDVLDQEVGVAFEAEPEPAAAPEAAEVAVEAEAVAPDLEIAPDEAAVEAEAVAPEMEIAPDEVAVDAEAVAPDLETVPDEAITADEAVAEKVAADEPPAVEVAAEAEPPTYTAVVVEPDWFADGDFAWLDAADLEAAGTTESAASAEPSPPVEAADFDQPGEPIELAEAASEPAFLDEPVPLPEPMLEPLPEPEPVAVFEAQPEAVAEFEPWQPPEPGASAETEAVSDTVVAAPGSLEPDASDETEEQTMSSSVAVQDLEEEVMWLGADPEPLPPVQPLPQQRAEAAPWPAVDAARPQVEGVRPPLAMTEDELSRLAEDEGWDESEVAAIRAMITPIPSGPVDLPGAAELHEAMAALEAVPVRSDPVYHPSRQWAKPAPDDQQATRPDDWAFEAEPAPPPRAAPRPPVDVTSTLRRSVNDPNWLRRRQGPAAAAYRRLRRLFPS